MGRTIAASGLILCASLVAFGQASETFDVASVKLSTVPPAGAPGTDGGPGTRYPEHYSAFTTLRGYAGTTKEQFPRMLQNLLTQRFKLAIHHETIVLSVYNLVVAKNGPKFKESPAAPQSEPLPLGDNIDKDGFPVVPPGQPVLMSRYTTRPSGPVSHWRVQQQPIAAFARMLGPSMNVNRTVVDKTGLTGTYDFTLFYDLQIPGAPAADTPALSIFDAVEQQLGLKLVDGKATFDKIVVDHAERVPTEN